MSKPQRVLSFSRGYATVEFLGEKKRVRSPIQLKKGDYIMSQANVAVQKIPEKRAQEMLKEWRILNEWK